MAVDARAQRYLSAMGIQVWEHRTQPATADAAAAPVPRRALGAEPAPAARESGLPPCPVPPDSPAAHASSRPESAGPERPQAPAATQVARMNWETLQATVAVCTACELHRGRSNTVFGVGNRQAEWMIIGEAPGAEEDRQGEPFVGRAGRLLNAMLEAVGLTREQVYIANVLKCRPPGNRDPKAEEIACCHAYLARQIALVRPRLILTVGRISAQSLLQSDAPVGRLRGRVHILPGSEIPLVVTYHPAYLLRKPTEKRKAWADLKLARAALQQPTD